MAFELFFGGDIKDHILDSTNARTANSLHFQGPGAQQQSVVEPWQGCTKRASTVGGMPSSFQNQ